MKNALILTLTGFMLLTLSSNLFAFDLQQIQINGFISQTYIHSAENNFFADTKEGSLQFNEVGLTLSTNLSNRLRVGMQLLSRDFGEEGNNEFVLDWGFGDYRFQDWAGIRVGKVKLPIGLYNEGRDSDFLRPMAFLPQSIYDDNKRNLLVAAQGGQLYGNIPVGFMGDIDYSIYYGELNFPDDSGQSRGLLGQAKAIATKKSLGTVTSFAANNEYAYGGSLIYNTPISGLRMAGSFFEGKTDFDITLLNVTTGAVTLADGEGQNENFWVASIEYANPRFTFASEYTEMKQVKEMFSTPIPGGISQGWYGLLTVQITDQLSISTLYDVFYADKNDKDGNTFVKQGKPAYFGWRKDLGIGARLDITKNWLLKAEYHDVDGAALGLPTYNPDGVQRNWNYFVVKSSFNF